MCSTVVFPLLPEIAEYYLGQGSGVRLRQLEMIAGCVFH